MPHTPGGPLPTSARQGRERQKYGDGGERLVAGCIPVRPAPGGGAGPGGVEVLLVTSRGGKGHVFPKGGWEVDETVEAAARRETVEEAGVRGVLEEPALGSFPSHSGKADAASTAHQGRCLVTVFALGVCEELEDWPERGQRTREWFPLLEVFSRCRYGWMREALAVWMERKGWADAIPPPPPSAAQSPQAAPPLSAAPPAEQGVHVQS